MNAFWQSLKGRMSKQPGGIDCKGVLAKLYEYIDGELDEETIEKVRVHIEKCKLCYPRYNFEAAFVRFLGQQGRASVPDELRRRVFESILEEESSN
jgi:anti-sigma factor (TIGR02949 family)